MKSLKVLAVTAIALSIAACQTNSPGLTGPQKPAPAAIKRVTIENSADGIEFNIDTRVDILFVIDDSESMKNHQKNLSNNIQQFIQEFSKINTIDFHIAFTNVHDRTRYGTIVPAVCGPTTTTPGRVNWEEPGSLGQLIDPTSHNPREGRRFVSRDDKDFAAVLKATLDPDQNKSLVKNLIQPDPKNPAICPYGPEQEELFSPLLGALNDPSRELGPNKDFRRAGAMFVAILVSDAKDETVKADGSPVTPEEVVLSIRKATGELQANKKMFRVFSVVMKPGDVIDKNDCKPDPAFARVETRKDGVPMYIQRYGERIKQDENPLATLAQLTQDQGGTDQVLSICEKNYGSVLAKYGAQVKQDVLKDVTVALDSYPQVFPVGDARRLSLFIGDKALKEDVEWHYDQNSTTITVYGQKIDWNAYPNAKIRVRYVPVDPNAKTTKPVRE